MELCKRRVGREESYSKSCITGSFLAPSIESSRGCRLQTQPNLDVQTGGFSAGACVRLQAEREGKLWVKWSYWSPQYIKIELKEVSCLYATLTWIYLDESFSDQNKVTQERNLLATVRGYFHCGICDKRWCTHGSPWLTVELQSACWFGDLNTMGQG